MSSQAMRKPTWAAKALWVAATVGLTPAAAFAIDVTTRMHLIGHHALSYPVTRERVAQETRGTSHGPESQGDGSIQIANETSIVSVGKRIIHINGDLVFGEQERPFPDLGLAGPAIRHLYAMVGDILYNGPQVRDASFGERTSIAAKLVLETAKPLIAQELLWHASEYSSVFNSRLLELSEYFHSALQQGRPPLTELLVQKAVASITAITLGDKLQLQFDSAGQVAGLEAEARIRTHQKSPLEPEEGSPLIVRIPPDPTAQTIDQQLLLERIRALNTSVPGSMVPDQ